MYLKLLSVLLLVSVSGCGGIKSTEDMLLGMYNVSEAGQIDFDSTKYIRMNNISCSPIMFELYQDTKTQKKGLVLLKAGVNSIENIGSGESLKFNLNGKYYQFKSDSDSTHYEDVYFGSVVGKYSYKTYLVPIDFVEAAGEAEELLVRISFLSGSFVDGRCSPMEKRHLKGVAAENVNESHLATGNLVAGTLGFKEFFRMSNSTAW
ncbi:hypothetical protein KO528_16940 [Saccharophagus degradans]|uniref:Lipoprotein n=1 Tax=Saccharophagus degradans TaxID=86304 RepID=A0AAW7X7V3_9GAMM|nr:hypothetical protein [Saccharophagus degradans]MBU2987056.1 hypothetical protein [Saccharophagus degradans]MDO6423753.1 hypothetical protein [Saccharophagus degradans]MDO6607833.1 hypothetical protein [Saccharophagus degradans]